MKPDTPIKISIHAPLAGRDVAIGDVYTSHIISIHAPLAGRDDSSFQGYPVSVNFNPRAPCGARQQI